MRKTLFFMAVTIAATIALSSAWYLYVWYLQPQENHGDVVIVFCGARGRVEAGIYLANRNKSNSLLLSPATTEKIFQYKKKWPHASAINFVVENQARTTFENALYSSRLIKTYGWKNVILVTSDYHMPRSYLLLRMMLFGNGMGVRCFQVESGENSWRMKLKEWCAVWYSLGEMIYYVFTGGVPQRSPKQMAREFLPSSLLPENTYKSKRK